ESDGLVALSLVEPSIARSIDRQMSNRSAARSVSALAAMLAHEVKNPLSGIRSAAQLLEQSVPDGERGLTTLICEDTDRILALVAKIINDHGGAIEYDSEPGRTTFRVMLPMQSPQAAP